MVHKYRQWFFYNGQICQPPFAAKLKDTAGMLDAANGYL
jgi:hypothetical protein